MAGEAGAAPDVLADLAAAPYEFDFFQALRRLECARPDLPRLGHALRADHESIRFGQSPSLAFAPATIAAFKTSASGAPPRLLVSFLGLLGPNGPMPHHVTEYVRDRELNNADPTLARFFDVFNHRVIALFYRAWAGAQQAVSHQRPGDDRFAEFVASLLGLGMPSLRRRDAVPDLAKLHYAGRLACHTRPPEGLIALIADYFGVPATLEEFVGQWLWLDEPRRLRLGESRETGALGRTAVVGARVWDRGQKFRLRLGPMVFDAYQSFLPGGAWLPHLAAWIRTYIGDEFTVELRLVLAAGAVPRTLLGKQGRLGYFTWLSTRAATRDAEDLTLTPTAA
ncbi:MAG: type VI secretion system baseplate subunit TssG [Phycisphaerales bacterium]